MPSRSPGWTVKFPEDGGGGAVGRSGGAQALADAGECIALGGTGERIAEQCECGFGQRFWGGGGLDELRHDGLVGEEIGHGEILYRDDASSHLIGEPGGAVERDGRDLEPGTFEGDGPGGSQGEGGALKGIGERTHFGFGCAFLSGAELVCEGCQFLGGQDQTGLDGQGGLDPCRGVQQDRQMTFEFSDPASRQQQHFRDGVGIGLGSGASLVPVDDGMPDEFHGESGCVFGVPGGFEGQDGKQAVVGKFHLAGAART